MRWARDVAHMGYKRNLFRVFVWKSERNKPLENPRDRPSYNTKTNLTEMGWDSLEWICLVQDRDKGHTVAKL